MKTLRLLLILLVSVPFVARAQAQGVHGKVLATSQFSLYDTIVHITSAQLKADSATPVTLVPAQGAGTIINVQSVTVSVVHTDGTTYTLLAGSGILSASLGTYGISNNAVVTDGRGNVVMTNLSTLTSNFITALGADNSYGNPVLLVGGNIGQVANAPVTDSIVNQPLILSMDHALSGAGTATLDVEVIYSIHKQ